MNGTDFALLERLHGHLGWLALAVLLHPVITLKTRKGRGRWTQLTADLGALLLLLPYGMGLLIYPGYRSHIKPDLWRQQQSVATLFECKEHLAAFAVVCALGGALALRSGATSGMGRQIAWALLLSGWAFGTISAVLGIWVAGHAHPAF